MLQICDTYCWFYDIQENNNNSNNNILPQVDSKFLYQFSPYFTVAIFADKELDDLTSIPQHIENNNDNNNSNSSSDSDDNNNAMDILSNKIRNNEKSKECKLPRMFELFDKNLGCLHSDILYTMNNSSNNGICLSVLLSYFLKCLNKYRFDRCIEIINLLLNLECKHFQSCINELYSIKYVYFKKYDTSGDFNIIKNKISIEKNLTKQNKKRLNKTFITKFKLKLINFTCHMACANVPGRICVLQLLYQTSNNNNWISQDDIVKFIKILGQQTKIHRYLKNPKILSYFDALAKKYTKLNQL